MKLFAAKYAPFRQTKYVIKNVSPQLSTEQRRGLLLTVFCPINRRSTFEKGGSTGAEPKPTPRGARHRKWRRRRLPASYDPRRVSNPFEKSRRRPPRRCTPTLICIRQLDTIECVSVYGLRARTMIIASASTAHAAALAKRRVAVIAIHQSNKTGCRMRHTLRDLTRPSGSVRSCD